MSDLADEFEGEDVLNIYPDVPSTPIFPAVPSRPIMPLAPKTTSKEKEILAVRRSEKYNSYVELLRSTLNICIKTCGMATRNATVRENMQKINNLVSDINTIDRNIAGGKRKKRKERKTKRNKMMHSLTQKRKRT